MTAPTPADDPTPDSIERSIDIDAPAERVWELVSHPGWWINDGVIVDNEVEDRGDHVLVRHADNGEFRIEIVALEPPRRAVFRWSAGERSGDGRTRVEFTVEDRAGGVTLRVVESGFTTLPADRRAATHRENSEGWESGLAAARSAVDGQE